MNPSASPLDLRLRLFGTGFRVQPSFFFMNLLFGYLFLMFGQDPRAGGITERASAHPIMYLAIWVGCAFVAILLHEMGHMFMARIFGVPSNIVLYSMGGLTIGEFERLARWQRIAVSLAGPAAGFSLYFALWIVQAQINARDHLLFPNHRTLHDTFNILFLMTLIWNLFNLIPVIPLDGGMVMKELVTGVFRRRGLALAYGFSLTLALGFALYSAAKFLERHLHLPFPLPYIPLDPIFTGVMFGMMALDNLTGLFSAAGRPEARPAEAPVTRRATGYEEKDW
jgi:stage IV sporulation protein FB